jgi:hypothetical protein
MNYWLTIHWPPFEDELNRIPEVEIQFNPSEVGLHNLLHKGDLVFVYRTITGPSFFKETERGEIVEINRMAEKSSGIKKIFTVKSEGWLKRKEEEWKNSRRWGEWYAELSETGYSGNIPRITVNQALGFKAGNTFRRYGPKGCGLNLLSEATGQKFLSLLKNDF